MSSVVYSECQVLCILNFGVVYSVFLYGSGTVAFCSGILAYIEQVQSYAGVLYEVQYRQAAEEVRVRPGQHLQV